MITTVCKISYGSQTVPPIVPAVQGDTGRAISFEIADFTPPAGATATYFILKPSGEAIYNSATITDNSILCELTAQSLAEAGENRMQVRVLQGEDIVTSFEVILMVRTFLGDDAIESGTEMNIFDQAVEQATEQFQENAEQIVEEVIESIPADYTALTEEVDELNERIDDEIADVKSALEETTGNEVIDFITGAYIDTSGSSCDITATIPGSWTYAVVPCVEGDVFTVSGVGGTNARLWAWVKSNGDIIDKANSYSSESERVLIAPTDASYLVLNNHENDTRQSYKGELLKKVVEVAEDATGKANAALTSLSMDSNGFKIPLELIYASSTGNVLDVNNVVYGMTPDVERNAFVFHPKALMSRLIPLRGATQVTVSGYTLPTDMKIAVGFLKTNEIKIESSSYVYRLTGTSRTINVPAGSVFAVVGFRPAKNKAAYNTFDYSGMKMSLTGTVTTDIFKPMFYGYASQYEHLGETVTFNGLVDNSIIPTSKTKNILNTSDVTTGYRGTDTSPYFVSASGCVMSKPIFVGGVSHITICSNSVSPNKRWIVFTSRPVMDEQYVVGVSGDFLANSSGTPTDYSIAVPEGAVWAYVTLKAVSGGDGWVNDTAAYGLNVTTDAYVPDASAGLLTHDASKAYTYRVLDEVNPVQKFVEYEAVREFAPYTVGTNSDAVSFTNGYSRFNLLFMTDSHVDYKNPVASLQNVQNTISLVNESGLPLSAICHAGDIITPFGVSKAEATRRFNLFANEAKKSKIPVLFAKGNHDLNDWQNTPARTFTDEDWSAMWYDYAENEYDIVRETKESTEKSTWNYLDFDDAKIRIICVDVQDTDKSATDSNGNVKYYGGNAWWISQEQMDWLVNTALDFDDKDDTGWGVICVMHQYINKDNQAYTIPKEAGEADIPSAISKFDLVCKAFNEQSTYSSEFTYPTDTFFNLSINADFTRYASAENKPYMICWLLGHEHFDRSETINGFPKIWTTNQSATDYYSDRRLARIPGTPTQNAFDLISIDTQKRKIRYVRGGAGKNCFGTGGSRFLPDGLSY